MADTKSVDASLWWDPFTLLLTELENSCLSSDLPQNLVKKLKDNHSWLLDAVSRFKPPNEKSKEALNSKKLQIGCHQLTVQTHLKDKALKISSSLQLDEVQSYILAERSLKHNNVAVDSMAQEFLHVIVIQYYTERQCLLKCIRWILMHAIYIGPGSKEHVIREEAKKLFHDGLENKLISLFQDLLLFSYPEQMDVDLYTLWAEETLVEDNLVLDILFLAYYDSFCNCSGERWKKLCTIYKGVISGQYNFRKLAITSEAWQLSYHVKVQLLLILIETLDLENLLQMVHDETPYRKGASTFSLTDVQEMDALVSTFNAFEMKEAGPLFLAWAAFLYLLLTLPGKDESNGLTEIDHVGYVRQAFEAASFSYCLEILECDILREYDGPMSGYRSVLRTLLSAFIASYEVNIRAEDSNPILILDILCKIYRGEESLCIQFWDKESFIDGPIRCLLCNLGGEFPFQRVELVQLLSSLCEGTWPAECVYNFIDRSIGVSSLFEISNESVADISHIVEAQQPVQVPGIEGFFIPMGTRGHVLKAFGRNTALVRWEYATSGVFLLLLRLTQEVHLNGKEEVLLTLDLLSRLVSFNTAVCFELMSLSCSAHFHTVGLIDEQKKNVWVIEIICNLVKNPSLNSYGAALMSKGIKILGKMLICSPSSVAAIALNANIFDMALQTTVFSGGNNASSSGSWMLSGKLAKLLLIDCEQNSNDCPLAISVLDFTIQLVETGVENDCLLALVIFSLQYVLVNHESWKYKMKHVRWKVTLKVLELMKKCNILMAYHGKVGEVIHDVLFSDSSIHKTLFQIACTTVNALEKLHLSRLFDPVEIEGLQFAISSVLDVLHVMLTKLSEEAASSYSVFHQAVLSCTINSVPVVAAVISLISYFRDPAIQIGAARFISFLFSIADSIQPFSYGTTFFAPESNQIMDLRHSVSYILSEQSSSNEDLFIATVNLLTSAAYHQPAFLIAIFTPEEKNNDQSIVVGDVKQQKSENVLPKGSKKSCQIDELTNYIARADDLIKSRPHILLSVLNFMIALWQGAPQYLNILESLRSSEKFWKYLSDAILKVAGSTALLVNLTEKDARNVANSYLCQSAILGIMSYELFLQKKLLHAESLVKDAAGSQGKEQGGAETEKYKAPVFCDVREIWSSWCKDSVLEKLMKSYTSGYNYDIYDSAKVAIGLFSVHVMEKLVAGDSGSLSVSLQQKFHATLTKLSMHPAFSELLCQYSQRGYRLSVEGKKLKKLILSDLYYQLQGELEGRKVGTGPFKELSQYLVESNIFETYQHHFNDDLCATTKNLYLFDLVRLRADIGLDVWYCSEWKASKEIAETMLHWLQDANSFMLASSSKLSALKALISVLTVYHDDALGRKSTREEIPDQIIFTCIDHICQSFHATIEKLAPVLDVSEDILNFLASQAELLLQFTRTVCKSLSFDISLLVLKCSGSGLKLLSELKLLSSRASVIMKLLLTLLLLVLDSNCLSSDLDGTIDKKSGEGFSKISNAILGLLPILCKCVAAPEHCLLSLSVMDLILRNFLMPATWLPVIRNHLQLKLLLLKLQDKTSSSIPIILKFLLTLARVKGGAEMLYGSGFLSSLRVLFAECDEVFSRIHSENVGSLHGRFEMPGDIWGLGLAVVTAMVQSLEDSSSCTALVESVIPYFFQENAYLIFRSLNAPDLPTDHHDKKRPRPQRSWISLANLKETEHTLMLMCELAKHWNSWAKAINEVDRQLRETCIHLLAFISRGTQRLGDLSDRSASLLCQPSLKEDFDSFLKPSFINSKNGWFALSPLCCVSKLKTNSVSTALTIYGEATKSTDLFPKTCFSDTFAVQIYRIACLLLKFLSLQAEGAVKRAEEVGFVDLAHFPELPMPEILHGLQDQAIEIVTELCEANKPRVSPQIQNLCYLLLQIIEMALQLELCVLQICGIRPVLGRVDDFSKEIKTLFGAMEGHAFLKASKKSLKQMVFLVYPGILQSERL
ncbi:uncharacterized protein LOC129292825 isoform X2 [Prosopis cineraria]|uniref:uncharacterized protein LOC129292825 isoform X2 n=1 Tax=Prosopis cineraria TaxID=364024 RepID=UPI00241080DB|nr:uncharacterized protein LOC129292825 isoform X2 [Prosopis cineraria]